MSTIWRKKTTQRIRRRNPKERTQTRFGQMEPHRYRCWCHYRRRNFCFDRNGCILSRRTCLGYLFYHRGYRLHLFIFSALCYSEFASLIPVEGSAYAYAYGTIGEFFAWLIGWGLILEYAMGSMAIAVSWSGYFNKMLKMFGIHLPNYLTSDIRNMKPSKQSIKVS